MLTRLAYSMLGSMSDARDIVQDAYLRWEKVNIEEIDYPGSYLSTMVSRLCLDHLKSARVQREEYIGPWLPEPVNDDYLMAPNRTSELGEEISIAFLHALEILTPLQRASLLLHDVFDYSYREVGEMLNRSTAACRKHAQRARHRLADSDELEGTTDPTTRDVPRSLVNEFVEALINRDIQTITQLLTEQAILYSDGGGEVTAARKPIYGSDKISRFLQGISKEPPSSIRVDIQKVNRQPALIVEIEGKIHSIWSFKASEVGIERIYVSMNPHKLNFVSPSKA
jgi:RNA polymerase sigma-70 factor (ECF subfamily)